MSEIKVVGLCLVRNEDRFIERVLLNIVDFCDVIHVADNGSTDGTLAIVEDLSRSCPKIHVHNVSHPRDAQELIREYCGTNTWVFGVDGDEIYDPAGLTDLRRDLDSGLHKDAWVLFGNVINCTEADEERGTVSGYEAPPCRSMTKLYNFSLIEDWYGCEGERLHGGTLVFKSGYDASLRRNLYEGVAWEDAAFRCLHMCFVSRSSKDKEAGLRRHPSEVYHAGVLQKVWTSLLRLFGRTPASSWKQEKYMRGDLIMKVVTEFFGKEGERGGEQ